MSIESSFRQRLNEVSFYLRSLRDIERRQAGRNGLFYRSKAALAASRASSFIMMYNCVEFGTKEVFRAIRVEAADGVPHFHELSDYWKSELLHNRFGKKLSKGMNFDNLLQEMKTAMPLLPKGLKDPNVVTELPFGGNINHEKLISLARTLGVNNWHPPKSSLGGSDLELIRNARNQLAHGDESFEVLGSQYSIDDIYQKLIRTREFMCAYIRALERYRRDGRYRSS